MTSEENKIPLTFEVIFRKLNVNYFTDYLTLIDSFFNLLFPFLGEEKVNNSISETQLWLFLLILIKDNNV